MCNVLKYCKIFKNVSVRLRLFLSNYLNQYCHPFLLLTTIGGPRIFYSQIACVFSTNEGIAISGLIICKKMRGILTLLIFELYF